MSAICGDLAAKRILATNCSSQAFIGIHVVVATPELYKNKGLTRCLSWKAGFVLVRCTHSLDDILSCCRRLSPCVLIVDQEPIEGADVAELIRDVKFDRGVKILVVGQQAIRETVQSILRAGCVGFLESGCSN